MLSCMSVHETSAGRFFHCRSERTVFLAVSAGELGDLVQVILRLVAVALLDLPQAVILPGLDVVGIGRQRALIPDPRELVVAELAVGVADQVGDGGIVVMSERLELIDRGRIILTVVDGGIGGAIVAGEFCVVLALLARDQLRALLALLARGGR